MNLNFAFLVMAVIYGLLFLSLIAIWLFVVRRHVSFRTGPLAKAKSRIEQSMVLEALSACANERDLNAILKSIGKHAAEMTGFKEWIIWMLDENERYRVRESRIDLKTNSQEDLPNSYDPHLYSWVTVNAAPIILRTNIAELASTEPMRESLARLINGVLMPFKDEEQVIGFIILGGEQQIREKRSEQFLSLFGAIAAILIKNAELHMREIALLQSQRRTESLAALGKMAARLAHEIRNPLTFIRSSTDCLRSNSLDPQKRETLTAGMAEEIERINQRVEELLSLGRIDPQRFAKIELCEVINKVAKLTEVKAAECGIGITVDLRADNLQVLGDADKLWQMFENLVMNGIQAMSDGGTLDLKCVVDGNEILVDIVDTGCGIDPENIEKIFDPFFSTKDRGTGLGLAIGFSIAKAHGGSLELVKTSSEGSCFRVRLPLAENKLKRKQ